MSLPGSRASEKSDSFLGSIFAKEQHTNSRRPSLGMSWVGTQLEFNIMTHCMLVLPGPFVGLPFISTIR